MNRSERMNYIHVATGIDGDRNIDQPNCCAVIYSESLLWNMLPKYIKGQQLQVSRSYIGYTDPNLDSDKRELPLKIYAFEELIDGLVDLAVWCIDKGYLGKGVNNG